MSEKTAEQEDNSLIRKSFSDIMTLNRMPSICFTFFVGLLLVAGNWAWAAETPATMLSTRSTVRVDRQSGRLIRTQLVSPREVPPIEVIAPSDATKPANSPAGESTGGNTGGSSGGSAVALQNPSRSAVDRIVEEASKTHGVDPILAKSVLQVESNYNQFALSPKGAMGYMQLMPATARQLGVSNAYDAKQNIEAGVRFLKYLKSQFSDERLVLAAYNAGEGAVRKHGWIPPYPETIDYVYKVGRRYGEAKRSQEAVKASLTQAVVAPPAPKIQQTVDAQGRIHIQMP